MMRTLQFKFILLRKAEVHSIIFGPWRQPKIQKQLDNFWDEMITAYPITSIVGLLYRAVKDQL